ncbi:hypothetical protein CL656_01535 [bacterium]|nr:hypothetical protein [bacterium]|tara:strand:+ start:1812 stop:2258 length:447 start_codon:yes stop_codon:yes gene_type:complete
MLIYNEYKFNQNKMKKFLKKASIMLCLTSILMGIFVFAPAGIASAFNTPISEVPSAIVQQTGGEGDLKSLVLRIVNFFLLFLGFLCVLFIIYAGFLYVTSATDEGNVDTAKGIMKNALIGILIILLSYSIVNTILSAPAAISSPTGAV